jgi:P4 family phage/plasmid primase-like protien
MLDASRLQQFITQHDQRENNGEAPRPRKAKRGIAESPESLRAYLEQHGCPVKETRDGDRGSKVLVLDGCPMNPDHGKGTDSAAIWRPTGIGFKCQHNGCSGYRWKDLRAKIDSEHADRTTADANADDAAFRIGELDPESGKIILSHADPLPSARVFLAHQYDHDEHVILKYYADEPYVWKGNRYVPIESAKLRQEIYHFTDGAVCPKADREGGEHLVRFKPTSAKVGALLDAIKAETHLDASITPLMWLVNDCDLPPARELIPCVSGTLHIPTRRWLSPNPRLFNTAALTFDFDANASEPTKWLAFLRQLWPDDPQSVDALQEWFGYCLTGMTKYQKMLLLICPRRSGKGTIGRVLRELVGAPNVAGPTTSSLATQFGLQPLIGAMLAIVSDARFSSESSSIIAIERLLCISGEDLLTIDRKHLPSVNMKLPTRFMFLSNELPRVADTSGALAGRFVVLMLQKSFYGREDTDLTERLLTELPGILLWGLDGLERLQHNGRFTQPDSSRDAMRQFADLASPVSAFIREFCVTGGEVQVPIDDLFAAWKEWCEAQGRDRPGTKQTFGRDLRAALPEVRERQPRTGERRHRVYVGIGLRHAVARDPEHCNSEIDLRAPSANTTHIAMPENACHRVPSPDDAPHYADSADWGSV